MTPTAILKPHVKDIGGFEVRRLLPAFPHKMVGPFIFFDHMGPTTFAPSEGIDVRPHPHIGLATVTYLFDGAMMHRDSLGSVQRIEPGDVNWMTAGEGIVHSERTGPEERAADIGCAGVILSNHGGRQLDDSRAAFDQLAEVVDAVGDRLDAMMDGGVQRGTHVLKALSLGAKAVGVGRYYLFPLAAAGQAGVERALEIMRAELERDMKLMGCSSIRQLSRANLRFR